MGHSPLLFLNNAERESDSLQVLFALELAVAHHTLRRIAHYQKYLLLNIQQLILVFLILIQNDGVRAIHFHVVTFSETRICFHIVRLVLTVILDGRCIVYDTFRCICNMEEQPLT